MLAMRVYVRARVTVRMWVDLCGPCSVYWLSIAMGMSEECVGEGPGGYQPLCDLRHDVMQIQLVWDNIIIVPY